MIGDFGDQRHVGTRARQNGCVDPKHVGIHKLRQAVDGGIGRTEGEDNGHKISP
jgi:hypothetical protein